MSVCRYIQKLPGTYRQRSFTLIDVGDMLDMQLSATVRTGLCTGVPWTDAPKTDVKRVRKVCRHRPAPATVVSAASSHSSLCFDADRPAIEALRAYLGVYQCLYSDSARTHHDEIVCVQITKLLSAHKANLYPAHGNESATHEELRVHFEGLLKDAAAAVPSGTLFPKTTPVDAKMMADFFAICEVSGPSKCIRNCFLSISGRGRGTCTLKLVCKCLPHLVP